MSSPLRLTTFTDYSKVKTSQNVNLFGSSVNIPTSFDTTNFTQGIGYLSDFEKRFELSPEEVNSPDYTGEYNSIFNGSKFYYRPTISSDDGNNNTNVRSSKRHGNLPNSGSQYDFLTNDINDISTNSIIAYCNNPKMPAMALKPSDFVFLKDYGVYPNNRLLVAKRFPSPVENDLTAVKFSPLSTIVTWIPDGQENFFEFSVGEKWNTNNTIGDPITELTGIFSKIFKAGMGDSVSKGIQGVADAALKAIPVGGIVEALETELANYFLRDGETGENGTNFSYDNLHVGNPNYLSQSSYRDINSITSKISIPVKVAYEMKFINGIDPTIAFMDLIQNLLRFSGSQSIFYLSQNGGKKINEFINKFTSGDWIGAVKMVVDAIIGAVTSLTNDIGDFISSIIKIGKDALSGDFSTNDVKSLLGSLTSRIGSASLARYRIEFAKIIPAMTGSSSAPWHVTIGNPKKPFFSSGDMVVSNSKVTFGNTLGFNDIPTRVEFSFELESARNLGIQEIFDKFNIGAGRQYQRNSIQFKTDFYQGSVQNNANKSDQTSTPGTGANVLPNSIINNNSNPYPTLGNGLAGPVQQ